MPTGHNTRQGRMAAQPSASPTPISAMWSRESWLRPGPSMSCAANAPAYCVSGAGRPRAQAATSARVLLSVILSGEVHTA
jgi:hypothetical protein